jgi:hypothetical protein
MHHASWAALAAIFAVCSCAASNIMHIMQQQTMEDSANKLHVFLKTLKCAAQLLLRQLSCRDLCNSSPGGVIMHSDKHLKLDKAKHDKRR